MKNSLYRFFTILSILFLTFVYACSNRELSLSKVLSKASGNKTYRKIEAEKFHAVLQEVLKEHRKELNHFDFINDFYQENGYEAVLLKRFIPKEGLEALSLALDSAGAHGINPTRFHAAAYQQLLQQVMDRSAIQNLDEAYRQVALLEITTADNLLHYSTALAYGLVRPQAIWKRYFMETQQPDSNYMRSVLSTADVKHLLDSIQPQSERYAHLQKRLQEQGPTDDDRTRAIRVTLERLRWKHTYDADNVVYVNIPAYRLTVYEQGKAISDMKVAVGKAGGHETPILSSKIHSVQVNPVWNIPESIASKEILKQVQADRFYLANKGIEVLEKNGQVIEDSEDIDWSALDQDNLPYRFQQTPGSDNALGRIKFLFKNNSAVYLHDTPAQAVFSRDVRAVSHGCVRVAQPLALAKALFGNGEKYQLIEREMETQETDAKNIDLKPQKWVVLDYQTVIEKDNQLEFWPDVYGLDRLFYAHLD